MRTVLRLGAAALAVAGVAAFSGPVAHAAPSSTNGTSGTSSSCSTWISGEWGHGRCYNSTPYTRTMHLHVECNAFYDPNVDRDVSVPAYSTVEAQGHCWSSVDWVTATI
ncbi:hypothetical protein [Kribbella sp. NPDC023855]|uniref:hypothetical protein n=1 Tax=Kribbella sp. NPDC023855 TaxID=3154698 RepID=UPI0033C54B36